MNLNQVTLPAINIAESVAFYEGLGFRLIVLAAPRYARFECPEGDATFSIELAEDLPTRTGVVLYFECDNLDEKVASLQERGYIFEQLPRDEPWLWREARLRDPSANVLCLYHAGENRRFPPWRIKA